MFEKETRQDLMEKEEEFKDRITSFENWVFMEGSGEGWNTNSLTLIPLFAFELLLKSQSLTPSLPLINNDLFSSSSI